jgi:signal transduction histidine kinase
MAGSALACRPGEGADFAQVKAGDASGPMTDQATMLVQDLRPAGVARSSVASGRSVLTRRWELAAFLVALVAGVVALWVTLDARFLAYPGWLAVQKADFIVGPVAVGLYWRLRRPDNRLGALMIALGLVAVPYILESSTRPALFPIGLITETPIYVMTSLVILSFPSGRLDGRAERLIMALVVLALVPLTLIEALVVPHAGPGFSISGCRASCPANGLAIWQPPSWLPQALDVQGAMLVALPIATAGVLVWRFLTGTSPRRRAMAIGGPIALLFVLMQAAYRALFLFAPDGLAPTAHPVQSALQWTFAGARAGIWYGFLLALIGAELYAGRVLRRLVRSSLGRPSFRELENMLRTSLGDRGLRLGFWDDNVCDWTNADGAPLESARPDQVSRAIKRDGRPVVTIIHDKQLVEDPELLRAAGGVSLLALENAELDAAWKDSLRALAASRTRLAKASDQERQKLERDLHDGAQQRLLAALIRLSLADELAGDNPALRKQLTATATELNVAIDELRDLAHGLYPAELADRGLPGALRAIARRASGRITVTASEQRFSPEIETAFYYCSLEAVQNALKHAGPLAQTSIALFTTGVDLHLEVRDTGPGFDPTRAHQGIGLQSMQDRLHAVGGQVEVVSTPGRGTVVVAAAPVGDAPPPG